MATCSARISCTLATASVGLRVSGFRAQGVQGVLAHRPKTGPNLPVALDRGTIHALLCSPVVPLLRFFLFEVPLIQPNSRFEKRIPLLFRGHAQMSTWQNVVGHEPCSDQEYSLSCKTELFFGVFRDSRSTGLGVAGVSSD